jgi:hypothetical protein
MNYPSLEQYNLALQSPKYALLDSALNSGSITKTGLGIPLAMCGGFALTYTLDVNNHKYAIRCFHKMSDNLEKRYSAISNTLKQLNSPYFIDFFYQPNGIRVNSSTYPIVKMEWAEGITLGEFLDINYRNKTNILTLVSSFKTLGDFLYRNQIAHGDLQPGNVMVSQNGKNLQLIDYDGMYVDTIKNLGSSELGHRNFQHPARDSTVWDPTLDRYSLIALNISLRALAENPILWVNTQSDPDAILFRADDYINPDQSSVFQSISQIPQFSEDIQNFASISKSPFNKIPTLDDFLQKKNIPQLSIRISTPSIPQKHYYSSPYEVLDATNYELCLKYVGDRIELIGQVTEVKINKTKYGRPYIFIDFGYWKGKILKGAIWSEALKVFSVVPDQSWEGKWVSLIGLLDPPYSNANSGYTHLSINITQQNQIHVITKEEADFRLGKSRPAYPKQSENMYLDNKKILSDIKSTNNTFTSKPTITQPSITKNQSVLVEMKKGSTATLSPVKTSQKSTTQPTYSYTQPISSANKKNDKKSINWLVVILIVFFLLICVFSIIPYM